MQQPSAMGRLTSDMFNQFAYFGRELVTNEQIYESVFTPTEEMIQRVFAHHRLSTEQFLKLFIQNVFISTYLSQDFPDLSIFRINHPIKEIVEDMLERICENNEIRPSTSKETTNTLVEMLEMELSKLYLRVQSGKNLSKDEQSRFIKACENFHTRIREHFQEAQTIFVHVEDNASLTREMFNRCVHLFYTECAYGRNWVMEFFEYSSLNYARIDLSSLKSITKGTVTMQTLSSEERYIECIVSSCLSLDEFIKIPMFIFHEYISHLSASIYLGAIHDKQQKIKAIKSYRDVSRKVDEGWMVHVADTFLQDNLDKFLKEDRKHLQYPLKLCLKVWTHNIHNSFGGEVYINEAEAGGKIADHFLTMLRRDICNDETQAKRFYYRFSFDLITRYPLLDFTHLHFINTIESLQAKHYTFLLEAVRESINTEQQYIEIERFWQYIKDYSPKVDLPIPRKPL